MVWAVFGQTVHFDFINYDDPGYVFMNPTIIQGFSLAGIGYAFFHFNVGTWFPLTDLSHQLDWQFFAANAGGHHFTNVCLHGANAILLFLLLSQLTGRQWPSAFVAAVFAIHPLRVESVAWVVERKDVLSGFFFMLTLWTWTRYAQQKKMVPRADGLAERPRDGRRNYFLALIFFALGLMSKSMLVTVPFVLLLLDYWPLQRLPAGTILVQRRAWWSLLWEKIPFVLLSAASCLITIFSAKNAVVIAHSISPVARTGNVLLAYTDYLWHMLWPVGLTVAYAPVEINSFTWPMGFSTLILLIISAVAYSGRKKYPYWSVGWLWYLGMLLPVIDIMQAGQNARADRYTYLPQIGLYILLTWGARDLTATWRHGRIVLGCTATGILATLLLGAYVQTSYWKNSITLWTHALACDSDHSFVNNNLGSALLNLDQAQDAIPYFQQALQLEPRFPEARINLGIALVKEGNHAAAVQQFDQALQLNPYSSAAHYNLGDALLQENKPAEAIPEFKRALELRPDYNEAHYDLGLALAAGEKWAEAGEQFQQALHFRVDETDAQYIAAVAFATQKRWPEAIALFKRVLLVKPDFAEGHDHLASALASQGNLAAAKSQFELALTLAQAQGNNALAKAIRDEMNSATTNMVLTNSVTAPHVPAF